MLTREEILRIELRLSAEGQTSIGRQINEHDAAMRGLIDDLECDVMFWKDKCTNHERR